MAAKEKAQESTDPESEETPKKSGKKKIIVGVLCLAIAGGAYQFGVRSSAAPATLAAGETTTTTMPIQKLGCEGTSTEEAPLSVAELPSMSINLAEGHYLRVTIALGLCDDVILAEGEEFLSAPARDIVVASLSGKTMAELADEVSRLQVKEDLTAKISAAYPAEVYEIYFVEFVMQ